ncbi:phosphatidylserine decarboxylase family protein [Fundidesulfovibrio butyratiphilus]
MRTPSFSLCREGLPAITLTLAATLCFALLGWGIPAVLALVALALTLNFFRDPERVAPHEPDLAVAPADGRVVKIAQVQDPMGDEVRTVVCIFMNLLDVHVNRSPVAGRLLARRYWPGTFVNASLDKASTDNERLAVRIQGDDGGQWTVVQIAGLLARRIVLWGDVGDRLDRGQRYGMIKFGSRLDVYLPKDYRPALEVGTKTRAGQTVIARKA